MVSADAREELRSTVKKSPLLELWRAAMWRPSLFLIAVCSISASAGAQSPGLSKSPGPTGRVDLREVLRREAARFSPRSSSRLFADLADVEVVKKLVVSREQTELLVSLEELTCDIFRGWLVRDLDSVPRPTGTELAARLAQREQMRSRLLGHVEAIVLQRVLEPWQARRWRLTAHQRATPLLKARVPSWEPSVTGDESPAELADNLRAVAKTHPNAGYLFSAIVPRWTGDPRPDLPEAQAALVRRVGEVSAKVIRMSMTRGLDNERLPSWSVLADRYRSCERVADSVSAHAEAIVLEVVLSPEESDRALAFTWRAGQLLALHDPQFQARLRLSASQRQELEYLVVERHNADCDLSKLGDVGLVIEGMPEGPARSELLTRACMQYNSELNARIWKVLNASQAREMERILGIKPPQPVSRTKQKKPTRPG
jgi:hypothetical protein